MTREEMVLAVTDTSSGYMGDICVSPEASLAIAAELRQTCAGCKHWNDGSDGMRADCVFVHEDGPCIIDMPADGSGFCHRWEVK